MVNNKTRKNPAQVWECKVMGERYWLTGVQLALLLFEDTPTSTKQKIFDVIKDKQFIGNFPLDKDKKRFEKSIGKIK